MNSICWCSAAHESTVISVGHILFNVLGIIGGIGGALAIFLYVAKRKDQRAFDRWVADQRIDQDTDDKQEALRSIESRLSEMEAQIRVDVPREAERIFLTDRTAVLVQSLGDQYDEYVRISNRLAMIVGESEAQYIPSPVFESVQRTIMPRYRLRERRERQIRILLAAVITLILLPSYLSPNSLVYAYFIGIFDASDYTRNAIYANVAIAVVIVSVLFYWIGRRWLATLLRKISHPKLLQWTSIALVGSSLILLLVLLGTDSPYFNSFDDTSNTSIGITCMLTTAAASFLLAVTWSGCWPRLRSFLARARAPRPTNPRRRGDRVSPSP